MSWNKKTTDKRILKGRKLQQARERLFREEPLCAHCKDRGRDTPATIRDHIIPLAEGGEDVRSNTQGLCDTCHDKKSEQERLRALGYKQTGCDVNGIPLRKGHHWK